MSAPHETYLETRDRFNDEAVAGSYVLKKNTLTTSKNRREMACIVDALDGLPPNSRVLDLPCGSGRLEAMLIEKGFQVVAADYSRPMLDAARAFHADGLLGNAESADRLHFEQQDIMHTTFADGYFDAVICNRLFHHYPASETRREVFRELARICSGRLIVSYYDNFALSALKFHLRNRLSGHRPTDRIPVWAGVFRSDYEACGLKSNRVLPVRYGVSPQTYIVLNKV